MRVLVCHRQRAMVQLARLNAERHGIVVEVAKNGNDLIKRAREEPPNVIVLGNDLANPSTDEIVKQLNADPRLRGVEVVIAKGLIPDLFKAKKIFKWPGSSV